MADSDSPVSPSMSLTTINGRLELVDQLVTASTVRSDIVALLRRSSDTLRLLQKFSIGKGDADDLLALAKTMKVTREIFTTVERHLKASGPRNPQFPGALDPLGLSEVLQRFDLDGTSRLAKRINDAIDEDGLSQQHLVEESEAASITTFANSRVTELGDGDSDIIPKSHKFAKASTNMKPEDEGRDIWIMRKK